MASVLVIPLCLLDYVWSGLLSSGRFYVSQDFASSVSLVLACFSREKETPVLGQGWLPAPIPIGPSSWPPVSPIMLCCFCKVSKDIMLCVPVNLGLQHSPWLGRITQWVFTGMSE